jgi:hypothetical protein
MSSGNMEIFKWIKDIEKIYKDLINNAKSVNLKDIEEFRELQKREFENFLSQKNQLVNNNLLSLSKDAESEVKIFRDKIDVAISNIETKFQQDIQNLQNLIIKETGLDF